MPADRTVRGPRSLARILALFALLARAPDGMSLGELSFALKSPKSSLWYLLRPLVAEGYLTHASDRYHLGPSIFRLSSRVISANIDSPVPDAR
ncbi:MULTISPECIES: helix-turn-helix domain-containing protein [Paraburkholderia]|uniref:helix-turn-helix domain-containing protein n=1 Tax=Paraburkholderia TaxID=1822464 RepID=UPI00351F1FF6